MFENMRICVVRCVVHTHTQSQKHLVHAVETVFECVSSLCRSQEVRRLTHRRGCEPCPKIYILLFTDDTHTAQRR